jgi:hypothetical protein
MMMMMMMMMRISPRVSAASNMHDVVSQSEFSSFSCVVADCVQYLKNMKIPVVTSSRMILFVLMLMLLQQQQQQPAVVSAASNHQVGAAPPCGGHPQRRRRCVLAFQSTVPAATAAARRGGGGGSESSLLLLLESHHVFPAYSWGRQGGPKGGTSSLSVRHKSWSLADSRPAVEAYEAKPMKMMMQRSRGGATVSSNGPKGNSSSRGNSGGMSRSMIQRLSRRTSSLSSRTSISSTNSLPRMMSMATNRKSSRGGRGRQLEMMTTQEVVSLVQSVAEHSPEIMAQQVTNAVRTVVTNGPEILGWAFAAVCFLQTKDTTSSSSSATSATSTRTTFTEAPAPLQPLVEQPPQWDATGGTMTARQNAAPPRREDGTFVYPCFCFIFGCVYKLTVLVFLRT